MAIKFTQLPVATTLSGAEIIPVVQAGQSRQTTAAKVAALGTTIAVLGDSTTHQNQLTDDSWPRLLEQTMRSCGGNVRVHNFGYGGSSFYGVQADAHFGGMTAVQAVVAVKPDIVIVQLGAVETLIGIGRTMPQILADADSLFATLRAELPTAKLVYASELAYDTSNFTASTLKNKGVIPFLFSLRSSGILAGKYCSEMLEDAASAGVKLSVGNWVSLDTHVKGLANVDAYYTVDYWKIHRLGAGAPDGLHLNAYGYVLVTGYAIQGLRTTPFFRTQFPYYEDDPTSPGDSPELLWASMMTATGDGWTWTQVESSAAENISRQAGVGLREYYPATWYLPNKTRFSITENFPGTVNIPASLTIQNGPPNSLLKYSVNGAEFTSLYLSTKRDGFLNIPSTSTSMSAGTHTDLYFNCADEVYGPFSVTVEASSGTVMLHAYLSASASIPSDSSPHTISTLVASSDSSGVTLASGVATIVTAGWYLVSAQLQIHTIDGSLCGANVTKNLGAAGEAVLWEDAATSKLVYWAGTMPSRAVYLNAGDTVCLRGANGYTGGSASPGATPYSHATQLNLWLLR